MRKRKWTILSCVQMLKGRFDLDSGTQNERLQNTGPGIHGQRFWWKLELIFLARVVHTWLIEGQRCLLQGTVPTNIFPHAHGIGLKSETEHFTVIFSSVHRWPECYAFPILVVPDKSKHPLELQHNEPKPLM